MGGIASDKSRDSTSVWGGQSPFLLDLYNQGQQQLQGFQPNQQVYDQSMQAWQQQLNPQANPYLNDMTQVYRDQLGQANQAAGGQAALGGGYGGGRHGVAEHLNQQSYASNVGGFLGQQYQQDMNRAQGALGMGGQMLGLDPYQQQWGNLNQYGNLLGSPTVLGQGSSSGQKFNIGK